MGKLKGEQWRWCSELGCSQGQGSFASSPHWIQKASASSTGVVPPSGMFYGRGEGPLSVF